MDPDGCEHGTPWYELCWACRGSAERKAGTVSEIMSIPEFKHGMMRLADAEQYPRVLAWRLVDAYMDADEDARRDCSQMLREDLAEIDPAVQEREHD